MVLANKILLLFVIAVHACAICALNFSSTKRRGLLSLIAFARLRFAFIRWCLVTHI